jgi:voltage-gated potassium channel
VNGERVRLRIFTVLMVGVLLLGALGFMQIEKFSLVDALYFTLVTVATVGYGDIHPTTTAGKLLAIVVIVTGVGTFLGVVANATEMMLNRRERQVRQAKVHTVIGVFFSDVGSRILSWFAKADPQVEQLRECFVVRSAWSEEQLSKIRQRLQSHEYRVDMEKVQLTELSAFLRSKSDFLLRLLENPVLLEREAFTELLQAVFHIADELSNRDLVGELPGVDRAHLAGDIQRAYGFLAPQWLDHMRYLRGSYPYLFSLAVRTNPFDPKASAVVQGASTDKVNGGP